MDREGGVCEGRSRKVIFDCEDLNEYSDSEEIEKDRNRDEDGRNSLRVAKRRGIIFEADIGEDDSCKFRKRLFAAVWFGRSTFRMPKRHGEANLLYFCDWKNIHAWYLCEKDQNSFGRVYGEDYKLLHGGKFLNDEVCCFEYDIKEGPTISMMNSLTGGSIQGKKDGQITGKKKRTRFSLRKEIKKLRRR